MVSTAVQESEEEKERERKKSEDGGERASERERVMAKPLQTLALLGSLRTLLFLFNVVFWVSEGVSSSILSTFRVPCEA